MNKRLMPNILLCLVLLIAGATSVFAATTAATPVVTITSPPSGANLTVSNGTSTSIVVGVTVVVNATTNISNVTVSLLDSANATVVTLVSNTTFNVAGNQLFNLTIVNADISGRSDGIRNYTLRVEVAATDSLTGLGNSSGNSSNVNISIVNTVPTFTLNAPANASNQTSTSVTFNFSVASSSYTPAGANDTYNFTCTVYSGVTNTTAISLNFRNSNASVITNASMTQKLHKWRAQCVDAFGIGANSSIRDVTVDGTAPTTANATSATSTVKYGSSVLLTCSGSDVVSNTSNATLSIEPAGLQGYRLLANSTTNNASFTFTETRELGFYNVNCTMVDYTGNQNSSIFTFEVVPAASGQKTPLSIINRGKGRVATIVVGRGGTANIGELVGEEQSRLLSDDATVKFTIAGEEHSAKVEAATEDSVTLLIQSEPQQVKINKGQSQDVDVNGDGFDDVRITYNGQDSAGRADMTFVGLEQPEPGAIPPSKEVPTPAPAPVESGSNSTLVIVIIVIIVVIIIGYFIMRRKQ